MVHTQARMHARTHTSIAQIIKSVNAKTMYQQYFCMSVSGRNLGGKAADTDIYSWATDDVYNAHKVALILLHYNISITAQMCCQLLLWHYWKTYPI